MEKKEVNKICILRLLLIAFIFCFSKQNMMSTTNSYQFYGFNHICGIEFKSLENPEEIYTDFFLYKATRVGLTTTKENVYYSYFDTQEDIEWFKNFIKNIPRSGFSPCTPYNSMFFADGVSFFQKGLNPYHTVTDFYAAMYAVIYFADERPPEIMWIGKHIVFRDFTYSISKSQLKELENYTKRFKSTARKPQIIHKWQNISKDYNSIHSISILFSSCNPPKIYNRYDFLTECQNNASNIKRVVLSKSSDSEKITELMDILSSMKYNTTLQYNTSNLDLNCYISENGDVVWDTENHNTEVIGTIAICQDKITTEEENELIWIDKNFIIQRGYYRYKAPKKLQNFIIQLFDSTP